MQKEIKALESRKKDRAQHCNIQQAAVLMIRSKGDLNCANVKEFSVGSSQKYINLIVDIDRSSKKITDLSTKRTPEYKSETLFLKVLVEVIFV